MSENFIIVSSAEQTCGRFQLKLGEERVPLKSPSLLSGTDMVWVVTSQKPNTLQRMRFGFTPHRSETRRDLLNLATDTVSRSDDDSDYDRLMGILMKPRNNIKLFEIREPSCYKKKKHVNKYNLLKLYYPVLQINNHPDSHWNPNLSNLKAYCL